MSGIDKKITITTLGTSHGDQKKDRYHSSTLIEYGDQSYLVDAGEPVAPILLRSGKKIKSLKAVFITHMHIDHTGGLPGLIHALGVYPEKGQSTKIFLTEENGIQSLTGWIKGQHLYKAYLPCYYELHSIKEGVVYKDDSIRATAISTDHFKAEFEQFPSYAYLLELGGKRIIFTGDLARDFSDFPEIAKKEPCDLCICEATHFNMAEALQMLKKYPIKKLVFNHVWDEWDGEGEQQLMKMAEVLPYPCVVAHDGDFFTL